MKTFTLILVLGVVIMFFIKMPYFSLVYSAMMIFAVTFIFTVLRLTDKYK